MAKTESLRFTDGQMIFQSGECGDCAYLIQAGRVAFFVNGDRGEVTLNMAGVGEIFGEMSLIDNQPRSASCRAVGDVELIVITRDQLTSRLEGADPLVRLLMRGFLQRLRNNLHLIGGGDYTAGSVLLAETHERERREVANRIELECSIVNAADEDRFIPYYQPICDLGTGRVVGCEALIRWQLPNGETIAPSLFMDILEDSEIILRVGNRMFEKCLHDLRMLREKHAGTPDFFVSINVSGRQFAQTGFLEGLEEIRKHHGAEAQFIKLEITERVMMDGAQILTVLQNCVNAGYRLAIDDFGTGFSSLQYLAAMPLNDLKIDRTFVRQMTHNARYFSMVKSLVNMADALGLHLIAEGIETTAELIALKQLGVEQGQGYLFARPLSLNDFLGLPPAPQPIGPLRAA